MPNAPDRWDIEANVEVILAPYKNKISSEEFETLVDDMKDYAFAVIAKDVAASNASAAVDQASKTNPLTEYDTYEQNTVDTLNELGYGYITSITPRELFGVEFVKRLFAAQLRIKFEPRLGSTWAKNPTELQSLFRIDKDQFLATLNYAPPAIVDNRYAGVSLLVPDFRAWYLETWSKLADKGIDNPNPVKQYKMLDDDFDAPFTDQEIECR